MAEHHKLRSLVAPIGIVLLIMGHIVTVTGFPNLKDVGCPPEHELAPCMCTDRVWDDLHVTCRDTNIKQLLEIFESPTNVTQRIRSLKMTESDLQSIPDDAFEGLELDQLVISSSKVDFIGEMTFASLKESLLELGISDSGLKEIPTDSLSYLESLIILDLSNNEIDKLHNYALQNLHNLEELDLRGNAITDIGGLAFDDCCSNLQNLNLAGNSLTIIPSESLRSLSNLTVLKLNHNSITAINKKAFVGLDTINILDLSKNYISSIEDEAFVSSSIRNLFLKNNKIMKLSPKAFNGLEDSLQWIDLSHNSLTEIPTQTLSNFSVLRHLDLSHNELILLPDGCMASFGRRLRYVELNNNKISTISPGALQGLTSVQLLSLAHNNLTKVVRDTAKPVLESAYVLDLSDNPLVCDCDIIWLRDWLETVNSLERTPDPSCFMEGTQHLQFVRYISCDQENEKQEESSKSPLCLNFGCFKALYKLFTKHITFY